MRIVVTSFVLVVLAACQANGPTMQALEVVSADSAFLADGLDDGAVASDVPEGPDSREIAVENDLAATDGHGEVEIVIPLEYPNCENDEDCAAGDPCYISELCVDGICTLQGLTIIDQCVYDDEPDTEACEPAVSTSAAKNTVVARINEIRALCGLAPVVYDPGHDEASAAAALMMVANAALSHDPPPGWACWTGPGADAAGKSNLFRHFSYTHELPDPAAAVDAFFADLEVESLGHRRWLLFPFLNQIAYGAAHGTPKVPSDYPFTWAAVVRVVYDNPPPTYAADDFVAYPIGTFPVTLMPLNWYLSFAFLPDQTSAWENSKVDLTDVTVQVRDPGNKSLFVHSIATSNEYFGLPNHVQWKVDQLKLGTTYTVTVSGALYQGEPLSHTYQFELIP